MCLTLQQPHEIARTPYSVQGDTIVETLQDAPDRECLPNIPVRDQIYCAFMFHLLPPPYTLRSSIEHLRG